MMSTCCSKHVEAWNKYIKKECVKLVIDQNYVKMHGQQNIKNLEFSSKNKFEKLVHIVGFIIRIYHDAQSSECQINWNKLLFFTTRYVFLPHSAITKLYIHINIYNTKLNMSHCRSGPRCEVSPQWIVRCHTYNNNYNKEHLGCYILYFYKAWRWLFRAETCSVVKQYYCFTINL
jgi:hypothetical protein